MTGVDDFFIYWPWRHNLGSGMQFQQNYWLGKPPGHISQWRLDKTYQWDLSQSYIEFTLSDKISSIWYPPDCGVLIDKYLLKFSKMFRLRVKNGVCRPIKLLQPKDPWSRYFLIFYVKWHNAWEVGKLSESRLHCKN